MRGNGRANPFSPCAVRFAHSLCYQLHQMEKSGNLVDRRLEMTKAAALNWRRPSVPEFAAITALLLLSHATICSGGESSKCLTVYKQGGAPAVFQSPKCPRWMLPNQDSRPPPRSSSSRSCQSAVLQGRRKYQEDRTLCVLDLRIPFPGKEGLKEVMVGIVGVFDGHNGAEASEMASKLLLEYFALHTYFLLDAAYSFVFKKSGVTLPNYVLNLDEELGRHDFDFERFKFPLPENFDDSFHLEILKEALLRAIHDIDATFTKEASKSNLDSGSTATIVLIADGQILVANIGDSKALLCSEKFQSPAEAKATLLRLYKERRRNGGVSSIRDYDDIKLATSNGLTHFVAVELTRDHHPDRDDERFRVETAGGYVLEWGGVPRVNGQLAVSRAIGDVFFKRYGVVSAPEVTGWQPLTRNDTYLVVASDGVFEKLSLQDVCDILTEVHGTGSEGSGLSSSCSYSLAECLVNAAFEKGSMDNTAAIVIPFGSVGISQDPPRERCIGDGGVNCSTVEVKKFMQKQSADYTTSSIAQMEHGHPLISRFDRLLVEGTLGDFGCYYLYENLDNNVEAGQAQENDLADYRHGLPHALPEASIHSCGGPLNLYTDQNMCLQFGMTIDGVKDQCINPEGFDSFLALLESIPLQDPGSSNATEFTMPDLRYVLKKRFGRGAYGEVWLAFHWNCHQDFNASSGRKKNENISFDGDCFHANKKNSSCNGHDYCGVHNDNLFILKRIMVERGAAVYLSGLREKYFGEVFLNASRCLRGLLVDGTAASLFEESEADFNEPLEINESVPGLGSSWNSESISVNTFIPERDAFEEGLDHIARFVESFESRSNEIWLVFHHEGISLAKLMYTVEEIENSTDKEEAKHVQMLQPSKWWHWLKTTEEGKEEMRNLIKHLLMALKSCHDRNITHRDIKPENMVMCFEDQESGKCLKGVPSRDKNYTTKMYCRRIIDFGSAIDDFTLKHLYGSTGPSRAEQTIEYTPPEAFLNASWYQGPTSLNLKYDMWSVGVVILELILGSPNIFQISSRTRALLDPHLVGWNEDLKELAYKLRSLMELCILIPGISLSDHRAMGQGGGSPASWKCSEEFFSHQIKSRDPLKLGFPNIWALRLVRQLLLWNPEDRLSADDALRHPYFHSSQEMS